MSICKGGEIWVLNTPSEALGFILADAGYEVWIGNTRTTKFSHGHTTFKTQNSVILQSQFNGPFHEKHTFIHKLTHTHTHTHTHTYIDTST